MKKKYSFFVALLMTFLALSSVSVAYSTPVKKTQLVTQFNAAPARPEVNLISPEQGELVALGTYTIEIYTNTPSGTITSVQLKIDGPESSAGWIDITTGLSGDYCSYDWNVNTAGDYSITTRVTNSAGRKADDSVAFTVTAAPPSPDFSLDASPITLTILKGSSDTTTITVTSLNGFSDLVVLTATVDPSADVSVSFTPTSVTPSATSTMTVAIGETAAAGTYTLTVTGTGGSLEHDIQLELIITAPPSYHTLTVQVQDEIEAAIEGATVTVDGLSDETNDLGNVVFSNVEEGTYTVTASMTGYTSASDTVILDSDQTITLTLPTAPDFDYELTIEIDYIVGHAPTQEVLDYIKWYYMGNNPSGDLISVTFDVDDPIPYMDSYASINDDEFLDIKEQYIDIDGGYYSNRKWVLYGTSVEGNSGIVGYCSVMVAQVGRRDFDGLAGNYIFIADGAADSWSDSNGIDRKGAEATVLMHEFGHSIGILVVNYHPRWGLSEVYDPDAGSVMSTLSTANAGLFGLWYYSDNYWATRNMEYYTI